MFILKKHLALYVEEIWIQVCCYVCHICWHNLFGFSNLHNLNSDTFLVSSEKKADKVFIFS